MWYRGESTAANAAILKSAIPEPPLPTAIVAKPDYQRYRFLKSGCCTDRETHYHGRKPRLSPTSQPNELFTSFLVGNLYWLIDRKSVV